MDRVEASFMRRSVWLPILLAILAILVPARTVLACPS
jgi:hypothetical protein